MKLKNVRTIEPIHPEETFGVEMRVAISKAEGAPRFALRHFEVAPGGCTPKHSHWWEHEIYIIDGEGKIDTGEGPARIEAGDTIYVAPDEEHQFRNTGSVPLRFICVVPHID